MNCAAADFVAENFYNYGRRDGVHYILDIYTITIYLSDENLYKYIV